MLTFLQFLAEENRVLKYRAEAEAGRVQANLSIPKLKAFTKNVKQARYIIDNKGKLHAGKADQYIHMDISDSVGAERKQQIRGYIEYRDGKLYHRAKYKTGQHSDDTSITSRIRHPLLAKMEKAGIKKAKKELDFEW